MKYFLPIFFLASANIANAECLVSDIKITSMKADFVKPCDAQSCKYSLKGIGTLENNCSEPTGVKLQITGYDKSNSPVSTNEFFPAGSRDIPPGKYTFSLKYSLDYEPSITHFTLEPVYVHKWEK